jgi:hypothetical protein
MKTHEGNDGGLVSGTVCRIIPRVISVKTVQKLQLYVHRVEMEIYR